MTLRPKREAIVLKVSWTRLTGNEQRRAAKFRRQASPPFGKNARFRGFCPHRNSAAIHGRARFVIRKREPERLSGAPASLAGKVARAETKRGLHA